MDEKLCEQRHNRIDEKLMTLEKRVERHGIQLDKLEVFSNRLEERLDSLIKQLSTLNTTIKRFIALIVGAFVSFFFYIIQQKIIP